MLQKIGKLLPVLAVPMLLAGIYWGLFWAPPETMMGDVQRIMYVHVPSMWMAFLAITLNVGCCIWYLVKPGWGADSLAEASAEVGLLFGGVGVALGSIWARPTWGVWWDWDPRLTSAAVMLVAYTGYTALRKFVDDPERRAVWSAVTGIIAFANMPVLWFSVKWWRTLHQVQSSPSTVDKPMVFVLRWNAFAFLFLMIFFLWRRYQLAYADRQAETALPPETPPSTAGALS